MPWIESILKGRSQSFVQEARLCARLCGIGVLLRVGLFWGGNLDGSQGVGCLSRRLLWPISRSSITYWQYHTRQNDGLADHRPSTNRTDRCRQGAGWGFCIICIGYCQPTCLTDHICDLLKGNGASRMEKAVIAYFHEAAGDVFGGRS